MKGKRVEDKGKNGVKGFISFVLFLVFLVLMIYSGWNIINWFMENQQSRIIMDELANTVSIDENVSNAEKYTVDFASLKSTNPDVVGWIKVNGTDIEFPVVKGNDNNYYLKHSFDRSYNSAGWIFMDSRNLCNGTDRNMVIYGHHRKDDSMFGTLKNILTPEWQNDSNNFRINFVTENEKAEYEVFSVYKVEVEDFYITTYFSDDEKFQDFIDTIKYRSQKNFNVEVTSRDHLLTLSTCDDNNDFRIVLHAKKIE